MSTRIILRVLALRHRLRQRDWWTRSQLEAHQARELRLLQEHAYARSPFYGRFHKGFSERPLHESLGHSLLRGASAGTARDSRVGMDPVSRPTSPAHVDQDEC